MHIFFILYNNTNQTSFDMFFLLNFQHLLVFFKPIHNYTALLSKSFNNSPPKNQQQKASLYAP